MLATYKRTDILHKTLESFSKLDTAGIKWELIVVDNADEAAARQIVDKFYDKLPVKYIVEKKAGKNSALNSAIDLAAGKLFIFTDDDVLVDSNWLIEMWEGTRRWPDFSVFGGRILPLFPNGKIPLSMDHPFYNSAYAFADWHIEEGPYGANKVYGPNMAIAADVFRSGWKFNQNIGPSGSNYIMGSESELLLRLEKAGYGAVYLPKCCVHHQIRHEQLSTKWLYGRAFRYGRMMAHSTGKQNLPCWFEVPRCFFRKLIEVAIRRVMYAYDNSKSVHYGIQYWMIKGQIYQFRTENKINQ